MNAHPRSFDAPFRVCCLSRGITLALALFGASACGGAPGIQSAKSGNHKELLSAIQQHELTPRQVRRLAEETLKREVRLSKDREDRVFIQSLRSCSSTIESALQARSETHDGVGAEAALLLVETNHFSKGTERFASDPDGAWRAIAAREETTNGAKRRAYFLDPDERVRRTALLAALQTQDAEDTAALLEVSRLDPDPVCRNRALQTLSLIGGEGVANALSDRYTNASEEVKLSIVDAWGSSALYDVRGKEQLKRIVSHEEGYPALYAARILADDTDETTKNQGMACLIRFAETGTSPERRQALRALPGYEEETTRILLSATESEDTEVALIAWARLLQSPKFRAQAQHHLSEIAESADPLAFQAQAALSAFGDREILPLLHRQLESQDPLTRRLAGRALLRLRAWDDVAPLLADEEASVRRTIACEISAQPLRPQFGEDGHPR